MRRLSKDEFFYVDVGSPGWYARILMGEVEVKFARNPVVKVPMDYYEAFASDIEGSLDNLAGRVPWLPEVIWTRPS